MDWFQNFYRIPQRFFFSESAMNGHPSWLTRCLIGVVFLVTTCFCRVTFYRVFNGFLESRFPRLDRFPWRPTFALVVKMSLAFYRVSTVLFFSRTQLRIEVVTAPLSIDWFILTASFFRRQDPDWLPAFLAPSPPPPSGIDRFPQCHLRLTC